MTDYRSLCIDVLMAVVDAGEDAGRLMGTCRAIANALKEEGTPPDKLRRRIAELEAEAVGLRLELTSVRNAHATLVNAAPVLPMSRVPQLEAECDTLRRRIAEMEAATRRPEAVSVGADVGLHATPLPEPWVTTGHTPEWRQGVGNAVECSLRATPLPPTHPPDVPVAVEDRSHVTTRPGGGAGDARDEAAERERQAALAGAGDPDGAAHATEETG